MARGKNESPSKDDRRADRQRGDGPRPPAMFDPHTILSIADALPVMVAFCDAGEVYRFCNQPIADWFERPRREILGRTVREVMGEASYALRRDAIAAALAGERQWFAAAFDHPTRGPLTTQAEYIPHRDESGAVTGIVMVVQDVTEQRAAEVALRESEARFRRIADSSPAPMWVTRADGSRDFVNSAYGEFFGFSADQLGLHDWMNAIHPDDAERLVAHYRQAVTGTEPFEMVGRFRRADGEWRWVRSVSRPRRDAEGNVAGFIGVGSDVTEAKESELALQRLVDERTEELSASERRFRAIFDSVSTVIVLLDLKGTVLNINHTEARWRQDPAEGAIGRPVWESPTIRRYPEHGGTLRDMVSRGARGETVERSATIEASGAIVAQVDMTLTPIRGDGGGIDYLLLEVRDVTELRAAQDQLRQSQKMEALGQLTGGIAHDFNNLLTVIVGGLDLLVKKLADERLLRYAVNALSAAERGARLTAQLLAFSRVQRLEIKPTGVAPLVDEMRPLLRNVLGPAIELEVDLEDEAAAIMADPTQLEVAMLNLAINARDAMPGGGRLAVRGRRVAIDDAPDLEPGDYFELSIADRGAGMTPEIAARAFEPFFTTKEVGKGTGLGLSMVYGMARQSGGVARIESVVGHGTTVRLYFRPAEPALLAPSTDGVASNQPKVQSVAHKVLVIDDDPDVRGFIVASLAERGYRIREAADGESGLAAFVAEPADVVIIDYLMPGMSGADVARAILAQRPDQKILFVSGYSETAAIRGAAPDAALLAKPFRGDTLDQAVRDLLDS